MHLLKNEITTEIKQFITFCFYELASNELDERDQCPITKNTKGSCPLRSWTEKYEKVNIAPIKH